MSRCTTTRSAVARCATNCLRAGCNAKVLAQTSRRSSNCRRPTIPFSLEDPLSSSSNRYAASHALCGFGDCSTFAFRSLPMLSGPRGPVLGSMLGS